MASAHTGTGPIGTLVMFTGELMCLILFALRQKGCSWFSCRNPALPAGESTQVRSSETKALLVNDDGNGEGVTTPSITLRSGLVCILPACCDLGGTTLSGIGLLFTTASVWQMLRGSIILFTGVLSVVFLKRRLERYKWLGMAITIIGITLVGISSVYVAPVMTIHGHSPVPYHSPVNSARAVRAAGHLLGTAAPVWRPFQLSATTRP